MIKFKCDICNNDKDRIAYNLKITSLDCDYAENQTKELISKTYLLCQDCYKKINLPNLYK